MVRSLALRSATRSILSDGSQPPLLSWLELLHPDGTADRVEVRPRAHAEARGADNAVDLFVLAATGVPDQGSSWFAAEIAVLARRLATDGVGYVVVPRRRRRTAVRIARRLGLAVGPWFVHVPPLPATRYIVPVDRRALRAAFSVIVPGHHWTRRLLPLLIGLGGMRRLPDVMPSVGLVVRRPEARPVFDWLFRLGSADAGRRGIPGGIAIVGMSWNDPHARAVLHGFCPGEGHPRFVAKVRAANPPDEANAEISALTRLGPVAERAGARVPRPLGFDRLGHRSVWIQSAVAGRPAADILASDARRLDDIVARVTDWLARWHALTRIHAGGYSALAHAVLGRLDALLPLIADGESYRSWLSNRCADISQKPFALTAAHNDLTMWNVLVPRDGLGIVDWEHATVESLPLSDAFYAVVDAVAASRGAGQRLQAVQACLQPNGPNARLATRVWTRLARELALPDEIVTLSFHACWLHHAANEASRPCGPSDPRPFLEIVRWLARTRLDLPPLASR